MAAVRPDEPEPGRWSRRRLDGSRELIAPRARAVRGVATRARGSCTSAARGSLLAGVPMSWMTMWAGGFPLYLEAPRAPRSSTWTATSTPTSASATRARWRATRPSRRCARSREHRGHHDDAADRGRRLGRRASWRAASALPFWQFSLTATDANRWMLRMCRQVTGRPRVRVFNWCYHGSVDESFVRLDERRRWRARARATSARRSTPPRPRAWPSSTRSTRSSAVLAHGDVACLLMEPALTNIGIVLPEPGFLDERARPRATRTGRC